MPRPIAHHQHLHRGRSVPGNGKERARGQRQLAFFLTRAKMDFAVFDRHRLVDRNRPGRPPFDLETLRSQVLRTAESRREWNRLSAIGELEINLRRQRITIAPDFVSFFSNRLLKLMQRELPLLYDRRSEEHTSELQ